MESARVEAIGSTNSVARDESRSNGLIYRSSKQKTFQVQPNSVCAKQPHCLDAKGILKTKILCERILSALYSEKSSVAVENVVPIFLPQLENDGSKHLAPFSTCVQLCFPCGLPIFEFPELIGC